MEKRIPNGWTSEAYITHNEAMRKADEKFHTERDRRYSEVKQAEEKALIIKDRADRDALELARQIQTYKDEKANELRTQIESERGHYVTRTEQQALEQKIEVTMKPVLEFIATQQGQGKGMREVYGWMLALIMFAVTIYFALNK